MQDVDFLSSYDYDQFYELLKQTHENYEKNKNIKTDGSEKIITEIEKINNVSEKNSSGLDIIVDDLMCVINNRNMEKALELVIDNVKDNDIVNFILEELVDDYGEKIICCVYENENLLSKILSRECSAKQHILRSYEKYYDNISIDNFKKLINNIKTKNILIDLVTNNKCEFVDVIIENNAIFEQDLIDVLKYVTTYKMLIILMKKVHDESVIIKEVSNNIHLFDVHEIRTLAREMNINLDFYVDKNLYFSDITSKLENNVLLITDVKLIMGMPDLFYLKLGEMIMFDDDVNEYLKIIKYLYNSSDSANDTNKKQIDIFLEKLKFTLEFDIDRYLEIENYVKYSI